MSTPWTCFAVADGAVLEHFDPHPFDFPPPYRSGGTWREGRYDRDLYRLVDGEVSERPPVPIIQSGEPLADGEAEVVLSELPDGVLLQMFREEGMLMRPDYRVRVIFAGAVAGGSLVLTFTEAGRYRLVWTCDPIYRPTTTLIEVPPP